MADAVLLAIVAHMNVAEPDNPAHGKLILVLGLEGFTKDNVPHDLAVLKELADFRVNVREVLVGGGKVVFSGENDASDFVFQFADGDERLGPVGVRAKTGPEATRRWSFEELFDKDLTIARLLDVVRNRAGLLALSRLLDRLIDRGPSAELAVLLRLPLPLLVLLRPSTVLDFRDGVSLDNGLRGHAVGADLEQNVLSLQILDEAFDEIESTLRRRPTKARLVVVRAESRLHLL